MTSKDYTLSPMLAYNMLASTSYLLSLFKPEPLNCGINTHPVFDDTSGTIIIIIK